MSAKNSLKERIKKPNATQAFFNSYDTDKDETNNDGIVESDNNIIIENENKENNNNESNIVDIDNNIEEKTYVTNDNNDNNIDDDYLRELAIGKKPTKKKNKKVFTSFYMDPDLAVEVDKIAARGEKGDKSKLINLSIRKLLEEYGVIEKK